MVIDACFRINRLQMGLGSVWFYPGESSDRFRRNAVGRKTGDLGFGGREVEKSAQDRRIGKRRGCQMAHGQDEEPVREEVAT